MSQGIDWAYWLKLPEIRVFEALALLHNTEPESKPPDTQDASPEYRKTLRLLLACLSDRSIFTPGTLNMGDPALHGVRLIEVGKWALANGYKLADKFPRPVQVSKALPPITPIRAAASYTPPRRSDSIDWAHWKKMPIVMLEEAVALSLNINPEPVIKEGNAAMSRRMNIALSNVKAGDLILYQRNSWYQSKSTVSLTKFAAWAAKIELENLPPDFVALAAPTEQLAPAQSTATPAPVASASDAKPWLQADPRDPAPERDWYTPARYFARTLVIEMPVLLANREKLADKVSTMLFKVGIKKRGGKLRFESGTVLKAFVNVTLG